MDYMADTAMSDSDNRNNSSYKLSYFILNSPAYVHLHGKAGMFKLLKYREDAIVLYKRGGVNNELVLPSYTLAGFAGGRVNSNIDCDSIAFTINSYLERVRSR